MWLKTGKKTQVSVRSVSVFLPGSGLRLFMSRVAHGTELGHEEVVATVVRWRVLLNVGKLHKLENGQRDEGNLH